MDRCEKEEVDLDDGLDGILSQSLDIFEQKSLDDDVIDITDMFVSGGPSLVMARRFRTAKGNPFETHLVLLFWFSTIPLGHNKLKISRKVL